MCPVSIRENLRVVSCNSGSSLKAEGKGRSREGFEDHTCFLISLKLFMLSASEQVSYVSVGIAATSASLLSTASFLLWLARRFRRNGEQLD